MIRSNNFEIKYKFVLSYVRLEVLICHYLIYNNGIGYSYIYIYNGDTNFVEYLNAWDNFVYPNPMSVEFMKVKYIWLDKQKRLKLMIAIDQSCGKKGWGNSDTILH